MKIKINNKEIKFKKLEISDRSTFLEKPPCKFISCEFAFSNLFIWSNSYQIFWAEYDNKFLLYNASEDLIFFPLFFPEPNDLMKISKAFQEIKKSGIIAYAPPEYLEKYPLVYNIFDCQCNRNLSDYIYLTQRLITLSGRKLSKKKNLISQFNRLFHNHKFEELFPDNIDKAIRLAESTSIAGNQNHKEELLALNKACRYWKELDLDGLALIVDEKLIAFSIFSRNIDSVCLINFEKVEYGYKGASQIINQGTAKKINDKFACDYLNREQDLGVEGLRKSKLSYDPDILLNNYFLYPK